jgi:hypothetical protein
MNKDKVLICCPVGDGKEYSVNEWFAWISKQTHDNFDIAVCVNGFSQESINKKIDLLRQVEINDKKIIVLDLPFNDYHTVKHKLAFSREILRLYALENDYDYIFWLDSDTIPYMLDAIPMLMSQNKDFISGLYFYKGTRQPVIIDADSHTNMEFSKIKDLVNTGEVVQIWGSGYGCLLMHRNAFSKASFDYKHKYESWSEDFIHCELLENAGVERWFYARVICKHYHKKDFTTY